MSQYGVGRREQFVSEVGALQTGRQQNLGLVVLVQTLRDVKCLIELLVYELPKKCTDDVSGSSKLYPLILTVKGIKCSVPQAVLLLVQTCEAGHISEAESCPGRGVEIL